MVTKALNFCFLAFPPNFAKLGDRLVLLVGSVSPYHKALKRADRKDSDINIQLLLRAREFYNLLPNIHHGTGNKRQATIPNIWRKIYALEEKTAVLVSLSS